MRAVLGREGHPRGQQGAKHPERLAVGEFDRTAGTDGQAASCINAYGARDLDRAPGIDGQTASVADGQPLDPIRGIAGGVPHDRAANRPRNHQRLGVAGVGVVANHRIVGRVCSPNARAVVFQPVALIQAALVHHRNPGVAEASDEVVGDGGRRRRNAEAVDQNPDRRAAVAPQGAAGNRRRGLVDMDRRQRRVP